MMLIVFSDVHANLSALEAVLEHVSEKYGSVVTFVCLGDLINYGMRPNEVVQRICELQGEGSLLACVRGNHEDNIVFDGPGEYVTPREESATLTTKNMLTEDSLAFLRTACDPLSFVQEFPSGKALFVHATLSSMTKTMDAIEMQSDDYGSFKYVCCGHSHLPSFLEIWKETQDPAMRNKRKTVFLNPGSVGQPRNHNPDAQYLAWDVESETFCFNKVSYDVSCEEKLYREGDFHDFYCTRLRKGV